MLTAERLRRLVTEEGFPQREAAMMEEFFSSMRKSLAEQPNVNFQEIERTFQLYIDKVVEFVKNPYPFPSYHKAITEPFDYSLQNEQLFSPLIDFERSYLGEKTSLDEISETLERRKNVIFFSNHQTEPDSQLIMLLLKNAGYDFSSSLISVAGDRVLTDPLAATLSLGLNLLSVYSKRYMDAIPEKREERQQHNRRTMQIMSTLLAEGGQCIYVAPSGGRDRRAADGSLPIAPFDPASIEMFRLMAEKSGVMTRFYPMTLNTHDLLPPPDKVQIELGEHRIASYTPIDVIVGNEIKWDMLPTSDNKHIARELRAKAIWDMVVANSRARRNS